MRTPQQTKDRMVPRILEQQRVDHAEGRRREPPNQREAENHYQRVAERSVAEKRDNKPRSRVNNLPVSDGFQDRKERSR